MQSGQEEVIMIVDNENNIINCAHEAIEADGAIAAQVSSLLNHILVEYISKYALFHICRKCDFNSEFF
jgi:hypothetical protein